MTGPAKKASPKKAEEKKESTSSEPAESSETIDYAEWNAKQAAASSSDKSAGEGLPQATPFGVPGITPNPPLETVLEDRKQEEAAVKKANEAVAKERAERAAEGGGATKKKSKASSDS